MKLSGVSVFFFFFFFLNYEKKKNEWLPVRTDLTVTFFAYSEKKKIHTLESFILLLFNQKSNVYWPVFSYLINSHQERNTQLKDGEVPQQTISRSGTFSSKDLSH